MPVEPAVATDTRFDEPSMDCEQAEPCQHVIARVAAEERQRRLQQQGGVEVRPTQREVRNTWIEDRERRPVRQRVQRAGEEGGDTDDQQQVRAAPADRLPSEIAEEPNREHGRRDAGDERPVGDSKKRERGRRSLVEVRGPEIAVQTGLDVGEGDDCETAQNDCGECPSKPRGSSIRSRGTCFGRETGQGCGVLLLVWAIAGVPRCV